MAESEHPVKAFGWAARDPSGILSPFTFSRRAAGEHDVRFTVLYCGIDYADFQMARNEWGFTQYPIVPGHEIVGIATEVGNMVQKFKVGDKVGVGCLVGSCRRCDQCAKNLENYCPIQIITYSGIYVDGTITYGGYSNVMVAVEKFVLHWPDSLPMDIGAALLCAGITSYSPFKHFGLHKPGMHVGIVGFRRLGHLVVKFAKAFGAKVTVISTSINKKREALEHLGADSFLFSHEIEYMEVISID